MLYGTSDAEPQTDIVSQLSQELYNSNLLLLLIQNLNRIDFEGKKDVAQVFNNVLRRQIGTRSPTVEYICTKPEILFTLMAGYEHQEIALNCGTMLRECARYEALAKIMLHSEEFFNFFQYVEVSTFDIASDAFSTFKVSRPSSSFFFNVSRKLKLEFISGTPHPPQNSVRRIFGSQLRQSLYTLSAVVELRKLRHKASESEAVRRVAVGPSQLYGESFFKFCFLNGDKTMNNFFLR